MGTRPNKARMGFEKFEAPVEADCETTGAPADAEAGVGVEADVGVAAYGPDFIPFHGVLLYKFTHARIRFLSYTAVFTQMALRKFTMRSNFFSCSVLA